MCIYREAERGNAGDGVTYSSKRYGEGIVKEL